MTSPNEHFSVVGSEDGHSWGVWDNVGNGQVGFRAASGRTVFTSGDRNMIERLCAELNDRARAGHSERGNRNG